MINDKKMFWISSYPKSGNTWLRLILCGLFFTEDGNLNNFNLLNKITGFDNLKNFRFVKKKSLDDYNIIFNGREYNEESVLAYSKYWIEAQKKINIEKGKFGLFPSSSFFIAPAITSVWKESSQNLFPSELTKIV